MSGGASPRGGTVESVSAYFPPVFSLEITKVINSSATHSFLPSPGGTWTAPLLLDRLSTEKENSLDDDEGWQEREIQP